MIEHLHSADKAESHEKTHQATHVGDKLDRRHGLVDLVLLIEKGHYPTFCYVKDTHWY